MSDKATRSMGLGQIFVAKYQSSRPSHSSDGTLDDVLIDDEGRLLVAHQHKAVTIQASTAKTATYNTADFTNNSWRGLAMFLDITASAGTSPTIDIKLQSKDPVSGKYFDIDGAVFAQKTTTGTDELRVYPGIAETANESVSDVLPLAWRVAVTIGGSAGQSFTFSLGGCYLI